MKAVLTLSRYSGLLLLSLLINVSPRADIYKWTDSQGITHYAESPPPGQPQQAREISRQLPPFHSLAKPDRLFPKPRKATRYSPKHPSRKYKRSDRQKACDRYRQQIKSIKKQLRAGYREPKGNRLRARRRELSEKLYNECR